MGMVVVLHSKTLMPLHPKAREFAKSGLFAGLSSFEELEKRIAAIPENKGKGTRLCLPRLSDVIRGNWPRSPRISRSEDA
jgi:hypothetical protein